MDKKALGLIETYGYVGAIEASDMALKTANIKLEGIEFVKGGIVTVKFIGDVAAVKASVEGGVDAVKKLGVFLRSHVIARLSDEACEIFLKESKGEDESEEKKDSNDNGSLEMNKNLVQNEEKQEEDLEDEVLNYNKEMDSSEKNKSISNISYKKTKKELLSMKVVKLRDLARKLEGISIERNEIKFANKKQLVDAISEYYERKMR